jgi:hypothetical protein
MRSIAMNCWRCSEVTKGASTCPSCGENQDVEVLRKADGRKMISKRMTPFETKCAVLDALLANLKKEIDDVRIMQARQDLNLDRLAKSIADGREFVRGRIAALAKSQTWHVTPVPMER